MGREKYTEVARTEPAQTGPRLRLAFPTIVVLEASTVVREREYTGFSIESLLCISSLYFITGRTRQEGSRVVGDIGHWAKKYKQDKTQDAAE